jgi:hypothetical protein
MAFIFNYKSLKIEQVEKHQELTKIQITAWLKSQFKGRCSTL